MPKGGKSGRQKALEGKRSMAEVLKKKHSVIQIKNSDRVFCKSHLSQKHGSIKMRGIRVIVFLKQEVDNMGYFWALQIPSCRGTPPKIPPHLHGFDEPFMIEKAHIFLHSRNRFSSSS